MNIKGKIIRILLVVALLFGNLKTSPVSAASLAPFSGFGNQLVDMDPSFWDLTNMVLNSGTLGATDSSASANFVVDVSSIANAIDHGTLKINFSASAYIADEPDELDLASITIGFSPSSSSPTTTSALNRTTDSPDSSLPLTSNQTIPVGTRYLFVQPASTGVGSNNSAEFSSFSLTINDSTDPTLDHSLSPAGWTNTNVEVTLTAGDTDSGVEGIYNASDSQVSSSEIYSFTATDNGSWTFTAKDNAGNVSTDLTVTVDGIDRVSPDAPILTPATTNWSGAAVGFTISEVTAGVGEAPISREYRLNGGEWQDYSEPASVSLEGEILLEARTLDLAGNTSEVVQATVKVDTSTPTILLEGTPHPQPLGGITITATINDTVSGVASTKYAAGSQTADYFESNGTTFTGNTFDLVSGGTYTVFAIDNAENSTVQEITVNSYPSLTDIDDQVVNEDSTITINFTVSDAETAANDLVVTATADDLTLFPSLSPVNTDGTVTLSLAPESNQNGSALISVTVTDGGARETSTNFNVTVNSVNDAPVANEDTASTSEDVSMDIDVLLNDADVDGDALTIVEIFDSTGGEVSIVESGSLIHFIPPENQYGEFSFSYTIEDTSAASSTASVTVTVDAVNDPPVITEITDQTINEDEPTGALNFSVTDVDDLSITVSAASDNIVLVPAPNITLASETGGDNSISIVPDQDQNGSANITISANDGTQTSTMTFVLSVAEVNDAPTLLDDLDVTTLEDTPVEISVLENDTDLEGDPFTITTKGEAASGDVTIPEGETTIVYTPDANFNGNDSFTYTATDSHGASSTASVVVSVTSVSDGPTAVDDDFAVEEDHTLTAYPLSNDTDPDISLNSDSLSITSISDPLFGTLTLAENKLSFDYTPDANSVSGETLTYEISDLTGKTSTATITIEITPLNDSPTALDDSFETDEDVALTLDVLGNDTDVDLSNEGDTLTIVAVDEVANAEAVVNTEKTNVLFTPDENWNGDTSFTYAMRDAQGETSNATVYIHVNAVNDAPVITPVDDQTTNEDESTDSLAFTVSDVDDLDAELTVSASSSNTTLVPSENIHLSTSAGGVNGITVEPALDQNGTVTLTITATDGEKTATESFVLTVSPVNDAPVLTDDTGIETNEDTAKVIDVLANDLDIESEILTITGIGTASHGTASITGDGTTVTYTPTANFNGTDTFTYTVSDESGAESTANVSLTVLSINDAPSAKADSVTLNEDVVTTIDALSNDTDVDLTTNPTYETKTLVSVGSPSHGTAEIVDNQIQYSPASNYFGSDSFTYTMQDTDLSQSTATVSLTITSVNDYPVFTNLASSYTVDEDDSITFHFNISDVETTTESLMLQAVSLNQTKVSDSDLVLGGLGDADTDTSLTITPNANQNQDVSIKLTLGDGFVTTVQSFTLTITPVNDAPSAVSDSYTFTEDNSITIDMDDLVNNDTDIDNDTLTFVRLVDASLTTGTLSVLDADEHTYTYTPPANFDDSATFQYVMTDGTVEKTGTVTLSASAINDAPILTLDGENPTNFDEDTSAVLNFTIADYETAAKLLAVQAGSSNSDVLPPDQIVINRNDDGTCSLTLTPNDDKNGSVVITLSVSDGTILVEEEISLTVNSIQDDPVATADSISVEMNGSISFSPLENDYDVDGDTLTIESLNKTDMKGAVSETSSGVLTYIATGALGSDSFTYTISDGQGNTSAATVSVTVTGENNPPSITGIANQFINEDNATGDLAFSVSDPDSGSVLTVESSSDNEALILSENVVITSTGTNTYTVNATPIANQYGTATITLTVTDENEASTSTSFVLTVYPVNDLPVAVDDAVSTAEDNSLSISAASILANDTDADAGTVLQITKVTDPTHGRLSYNSTTKIYTYQPDGNFNGSDSFVYTMTDGVTTDTGTVTITITAVNDTPVAYSNWLTVTAALGASVNVDVRTNDYDIETSDANLTVTILTDPSYGTATLESNGTVTYTRSGTDNAADWKDSFTYRVQDNNDPPATSNIATVYIDDYWGPSSYGDDQSVGMNEDTATAITLSVHDGYGEGYTLSFPAPTLGTITDTNPNDQYISYTPNLNASGSETITYTMVSNHTGNPTDTINLYITIYPINDAPAILPALDDVTIDEDESTDMLHVDISDPETSASDLVFTASSSDSDLVLDSGIAITRTAGSIDLVITPIENRFGTATITLLASDGIEQTTQNFTLTVTSVNDVPMADNVNASTNEDFPVTITVISPNADVDGDSLTLTVPVEPTHGTVVINGDKTITYTPSANYNGSDTFTYQLADTLSSDTGVVSVTINPVNDPPAINNLAYDYATIEDTPKTVIFKVTDVDNSLSSSNVTVTAGNTTLFPEGSIVVSGTGEDITVVLSPYANLSGTSTQTVTLSDGSLSVTQDFVLTVSAVNDIPVATDDEVTTDEDTAVTFNVVTNDTDIEAGTLTVVSFTNPDHGTVRNNRDGTLTYTPSANYFGLDDFTYTITDVNNGQDTATVSMTIDPVNDAPLAVTDSTTILEDNSVTLDLLANDSDIEGSTLTVTGISDATKGSFVDHGDGTITYTPDADENGLDSFTYTVSDGELTSTGTINIQITAINDAPRLSSSVDRPWTLDEDTPTSFPITIVDPETPSDNLVIKITSSVQSLVPDTSITLTGSGQNKFIRLTPNLNQFGTLNLTIDASDGVNTTTVVYEVIVLSVNDQPTISAIADKTTTEDTPTASASFTVSDIETAATDLSVTAVTADGVLLPAANVVVTKGSGGNRSVVVTPGSNQVGSALVTLTVHDADGGTADESFTVTVTAVNDAPLAADDTASVNEDDSVVIDVLANDTDVDLLDEGDTLTIVSTSGVDNATVSIAADNKSLTFTPSANWNGSETFAYMMKDAVGVTSSASVTVTVSPVNDAPDAVNDSTTTAEDTSKVIYPLANDTDIDLSREGDDLTIISTDNVDNGEVTISTDKKSITFVPDANWSGDETFTYTITDQNGATDSADVTIAVTAVNDAPSISDIPDQTLTEDVSSGEISFSVADIDTLSGDLIVTAATSNGTVIPLSGITFGGSGSSNTVTITPATNKNTWSFANSIDEPATLTVTVSDGFLSASDTFLVTVTPVNDSPVAVNDTAGTTEDHSIAISVLTNDSDVDISNEGDSITVTNTSGVDNGTVSIAGDGKSLTFTPSLNFNGSEEFSYTIQDSHGESASASVTVTVTAVNDAPTISDTTNQTIDEDSTTGALTFTIADVDNTISCSNVSKTSSRTTTIPAANVVIGGSGTSCTVTVTPSANKNTYVQSAVIITLTVTDGSLTASDTFTVTINKVNDAPIASADTSTINEDGVATINALSNDTDVDTVNEGDTLTILSTDSVDNGVATIATDKLSITFTPNSNWYGTETFNYTITDLAEATSTSTVTITVNPVNDAPTISDLPNQEITEDSSTEAISFTVNDIDDALSSLDVSATTANGTIVPLSGIVFGGSDDSRTVTVTPGSNRNTYLSGPITVNVTVEDAGGLTATDSFTMTVTKVNDAPQAQDDSANSPEDIAVAISVIANDLDSDLDNEGEVLSVVSTSGVENGQATISGNKQSITFTPAANWYGTESFSYTMQDSALVSSVATVTVTITAANDSPLAADDSAEVDEDDSVTIDVLSNDTDIDLSREGDTLTILSVAGVDHGSVSIATDHLSLSFTPTADWTGTETFSYTIRDSANAQSTASVDVTVNPLNDPPIAKDDSFTIDEDQAVNLSVLANDEDVDLLFEGDALIVLSVSPSSNGTVAVNEDQKTIDYTPNLDWLGTETLTYTMEDKDHEQSTAILTILVTSINDTPVANPDSETTPEDTPAIILVLENDQDADLDEGDVISIVSTSGVDNGSVSIASDKQSLTFTPSANWNGTESFAYVIRDAENATASSTVTVEVTAVNDAPSANDDSSSTDEDTSVLVDLTSNDTDVDLAYGDQLQVINTSGVDHGEIEISTDKTSVRFTPDSDWVGTEEFSYTVNDKNGSTSSADVSITVSPVNDAPVAVFDADHTDEDTEFTLDLLANDTDVDAGDELTLVSVSNVDNAVVTIAADHKSAIFAPALNWNGTETFSYTMRDAAGLTSSANVAVVVAAVNDNPIANPDENTTDEDVSVSIDVLANDTDVDKSTNSDSFTIKSVAELDNGQAEISTDKTSLTFTPNNNWNGTEVFSYTIVDSLGAESTSSVTVTVNPQPDTSQANADSATCDEDGSVTVSVLDNDVDYDHTPSTKTLSVISTSDEAHGSVEIAVDGLSVTYTPDPDWNGTDTFTYTIRDSNLRTSSAIVTVAVSPTNDAPLALDDQETTNEDTVLVIDVLTNDEDPDLNVSEGDTLLITGTSGTSAGTIEIATDQKSITYTPLADWVGEETFTYTIKDKNNLTSSADVTITVDPVDDAPVFSGISNQTILEDTSTSEIEFTLSDIDSLLDEVDVSASSSNTSVVPLSGIVLSGSGADRSLVVSPALNKNTHGSSPVTITLTAGAGTTTFQLTVTAVNDAPAAVMDTYSMQEDTSLTLEPLKNDTDVDITNEGDTLTIIGTAGVNNASVQIASNGKSIKFTPNANWAGTEEFTYTIQDNNGLLSSSTIKVNVADVPDIVPTATPTATPVPVYSFNVLTPNGGAFKDGNTISVSWTPLLAAGVTYKLEFFNGSAWSTLSTGLTVTSYQHPLVNTQLHTNQAKYRVTALYGGSLSQNAASQPFIIDNLAPQNIRITLNAGDQTSYLDGVLTSSSVAIMASEGWDLTGIKINILEGSTILASGGSGVSTQVETVGSHTIKIEAVDPLGNSAVVGVYVINIIDPGEDDGFGLPSYPGETTSTSTPASGSSIEPTATPEPFLPGYVVLDFPDDPGDPKNPNDTILILPDGTEITLTDEHTWQATEDGEYTYISTDENGDQLIMIITVTGKQIASIEELKQVNGVIIPAGNSMPPSNEDGTFTTGEGNPPWVLPLFSGFLLLLLLLLWPNVKIVYFFKQTDGRMKKVTRYKWVIAPEDNDLEIKVKNAHRYEITLSRWLTRSVRGGSLAIKPESFSSMFSAVDIPKNAKNRFRTGF